MEYYLMLVYHIEPMGYTSVGEHRIYGKFFNYGRFGPTDIPRSLFKKNKNILEEVEYTSELLEEKFGKKFPEVRFKLSEFWKVDFNTLVKIAILIGINYRRKNGKPTNLEKRALRKSVMNYISE